MNKVIFILIYCFITAFIFTPKATSQVVINEFLPNPEEENDWVELYSEIDVDISGWIIDDEGTQSVFATIPPNTIIGPSTDKYFIVENDNRLNQATDTIYLYDSTNTLKDKQTYSNNPGINISFGRFPDGGAWGVCQPTKKSSNLNCFFSSPTPTPTPTATLKPTPKSDPTSSPNPSFNPPPTIIPTPKPTPKLAAQISPSSSVETSVQVLSQMDKVSPSLVVMEETTKSDSIKLPMGILFIGVGILLSGGAGYLAYKQTLKQKLV